MSYIFGDHARGEAEPASKLKIAIEYEGNVSDDMMRSWQQENSTDFAELERALGIETSSTSIKTTTCGRPSETRRARPSWRYEK